jgi:hypothetical protein
VIEDALAFWRGEPRPAPYRRHPALRRRTAVDFVAQVIDHNLLLTAGRRL